MFINDVKIVFILIVHTPEMLAGQRDGRHRQADDDFGGWAKTTALVVAVSGQSYWNLGTM